MADLSNVPEFPEWLENPPTYLFQTHEAPSEAANANAVLDRPDATKKANAVLDNVCRELAATTTGSRNSELNKTAYTLAGFAAGGAALDRDEVEARLRAACEVNGAIQDDGLRKFRGSFKSGWESGLKRPIVLEAGDRAEPSAHFAEGGTRERSKFRTTWFSDVKANVVKLWMIDRFLGAGETSVVVGKPGSGKSAVVTDAACHKAAGRKWHGRNLSAGLVVYIAAERTSLTKRRLAAFRKRHKIEHWIPLLIVDGKPDFTSGLDDSRELIALIREAEEQTGLKCEWVIIDTLSRAFGPGDQHQSKDMKRYCDSVDELSRSLGAHVTSIHHTPWNEDRGKGAIDLDGVVDVPFIVRNHGGTYSLVCDGANDQDEGPVTRFAMESEEVGVDEDGNVTTAPVIVKLDPDTTKVELGGGKSITFNKGRTPKTVVILRKALDEAGQDHASGRRAVHVDELRARFRAEFSKGGKEKSDESLNAMVRSALTKLQKDGDAEKIGDLFLAQETEGSGAHGKEF